MQSRPADRGHTRNGRASNSPRAARIQRARFLSTVAGLCAGLMLVHAQAAFQAVEDFDSLTLADIDGQNGWTASLNSGEVVLDPAGGSNQVLRVLTESGDLYKAASVTEGTTRMLFLRFRFEEHGAYSFGLSPASRPEEYVDFSPELGMAAATAGDPNNELRAANGSTLNIYDVLEALAPSVWYNVWIMVDAGTDTYQVWLNADPGGAADNGDLLDNDEAETVFGFRTATAGDLFNFFIKTGGGASPVDGRFYLDDIYLEDTDAVNLSNPAGDTGGEAAIVASVLPTSRSVEVGATATAFATMINTGAVAATDCFIAPITSVPADFLYQTTDPATNALTGTPDTPVSIPAGASQAFLIAFTPTAAFAPTDVQLNFDCANTNPALSVSGLNTLLLSASSSPVSDIVPLAATPTADGIVNLPGAQGANAFAVATVNVGALGDITATADTGTAVLPVSLFICETNPATGACLSDPDTSTTSTIDAGATPTFSVFVNGNGSIPFDPATNRIFVRFEDAGGETRGSTSVAVRTLQ